MPSRHLGVVLSDAAREIELLQSPSPYGAIQDVFFDRFVSQSALHGKLHGMKGDKDETN